MDYINFAIVILISFLLIQSAISTYPLIFYICSESQYFITNSSYDKNLRKLLADLSHKTPPTGFGIGSRGHCYNRTYGLALCRGDVSSNDCKACDLEASSEILKRYCPNDKGAIIWYESCYLKYTDADFFGKIDEDRFRMWNWNNVSMIEPQKLNQTVHELLTNLSQKARETSKMFARGELEVEKILKIYGMVQCSRDLSDIDCQKCLSDSISIVRCHGKQAGGVFGGSCYVRYDIHPFPPSLLIDMVF